MEFLSSPELASQMAALGQVLMIDLVLRGQRRAVASRRGLARARKKRPDRLAAAYPCSSASP